MSERVRKVDVEHALEQAANTALYGSPAARAGQIGTEARIVQRILAEAQGAAATWANWEAINNELLPEKETAKAIEHLELGALGTIRNALSRDGLLAAYRLSDPFNPGQKTQGMTLCRLVHLTKEPTALAKLTSKQWALDLGHRPNVSNYAQGENTRMLHRLHSLVSAQWKADAPPAVPELWQLRNSIRPVRDGFLAHTLDIEGVQHPIINDIRQLIQLTLELATDMAFVFLGSATPAARYQQFCRARAEKFWLLALKAPIEIYQSDMLLRDGAADGKKA